MVYFLNLHHIYIKRIKVMRGKHSEETKARMRASQRARFDRETEEERQQRINKLKESYAKIAEIRREQERREQYEIYRNFIRMEYNRLNL